MGLQTDWFNQRILITSPTTSVDAQVLHDFIEDEMASPRGLTESDIIQPEGKVEDPANPGVYSQIILIFNSPWQVQFWGGSGYTRIYGGKIVGGLSDEVIKATGTAGDITVLESPVDGVTVSTGGTSVLTDEEKAYLASIPQIETDMTAQTADVEFLRKKSQNEYVTDPDTGEHILYDDLGNPEYKGDIFEDVNETIPYRGQGVERRKRLDPI